MTLTPIVERLAVELSLPVFKTVAAGIRTPNLPLATALTHCATAVVPVYVEDILRDSYLPKKCFPIQLGRGSGNLMPGKIWSPHPIYKKLVKGSLVVLHQKMITHDNGPAYIYSNNVTGTGDI